MSQDCLHVLGEHRTVSSNSYSCGVQSIKIFVRQCCTNGFVQILEVCFCLFYSFAVLLDRVSYFLGSVIELMSRLEEAKKRRLFVLIDVWRENIRIVKRQLFNLRASA